MPKNASLTLQISGMSCAYNVLLIPIAAGVLYLISGMRLSPILATGAMSLSSVFVLSNALRLQRVKPLA